MRTIWVSLCLAMSVLMTTVAHGQDEGATALSATQYVDLKPPFVTNYGGVGRLHYLKTEVTLRVGGGQVGVNHIRHHMPAIRHQLVMLFSRQTNEELSSIEGREMLRQQALETVQTVLTEEEGEQHVVDLLFNSFIVQR